MSNDEFESAAPPASGDRIEWEAQLGKLLVVEPLSLESNIQTSNGPSDAVRANVYVITGVGTSDDYEDSLIFPRVLQGQLRSKIGSKVVGRLAKGQAQPGKTAPWTLLPASEDDLGKARAWKAARQASSLVSAAPAAPVSTGATPPF